MKQIKAWVKTKVGRLCMTCGAAAPAIFISASAAGDATTSSIVTALTSSVQTMITDTMSSVAAIMPIVLPLIGVGILVAYVIKFIKRITGKA